METPSSLLTWSSLLRASRALGLITVLFLFGAGIVTFVQLQDPPIAIEPFKITAGTDTGSFAPESIADQVKSAIDHIYSGAGSLFDTRKLGDSTIPLDVSIGHGLTFQSLLGLYLKLTHQSLTVADISGRVFEENKQLVLEWTTNKPGEVIYDSVPFALPGTALVTGQPDATTEPPFKSLEQAVSCVALKIIADISPDVAANYLHLNEEKDASGRQRVCLSDDDVALYSRVSSSDQAPAASRINAQVGLSVHYSHQFQYSEELGAAKAAVEYAQQLLPCDEAPPPRSAWRRLTCKVTLRRNDRDQKAVIAAWMQMGIAYSDSASVAGTVGEMVELRQNAIEAYDHAIAVSPNFAPAYDAKGLQLQLVRDKDAKQEYERSLRILPSSAAHLDLGMWYIHGRNDYFDDRELRRDELDAAEEHFREATAREPTYWDAHAALGYVMYERGRYEDAIGDLEAALSNDKFNRPLRRFLGKSYVRLCRLDDARSRFRSAYLDLREIDKSHPRDKPLAPTVLVDWGKVLDEFGFHLAALEQESRVLSSALNPIDAAQFHGEIQLAGSDEAKIAEGLAELKAAVAADETKLDAVMASYLTALLRAGRTAEALDLYKRWGDENLVPPPAPDATFDAQLLPSKLRVRSSYARALLQNKQWDAALQEFEVLSYFGIAPESSEVADMHAQAVDAHAPPHVLEKIGQFAATIPASNRSTVSHGCLFADLPAAASLKKVAIDDTSP